MEPLGNMEFIGTLQGKDRFPVLLPRKALLTITFANSRNPENGLILLMDKILHYPL